METLEQRVRIQAVYVLSISSERCLVRDSGRMVVDVHANTES